MLSFRRRKQEDPWKYFRENPGIKWSQYIPIEDKPIQYLEIGVHKGINVVDIAKSYCKHPNSKIHCVDPWIDYDEYPEYKGQQDVLFSIFNTAIRGYEDKCVIHRGFSDTIVPTFEDNFFDISFVDGNHETEYVYRDGCMSFEKVKTGGYIICDDYLTSWSQTMKGIDKFLTEYSDKIQIVARPNSVGQVIVKKIYLLAHNTNATQDS